MKLSYLVLIALGALTAGLLVYGWWVLPRRLRFQMRSSLRAFAKAIELRFPLSRELSEEIRQLAHEVGLRLGLSQHRLHDLDMAVSLRDIGLCAVPYRLLNRIPFEKWTDAEHATFLRHAEVGAAVLELVPSLKHIAPIVRHHEYPLDPARVEEPIPLEAKILRAVSHYVWARRYQGGLLAEEMLRNEAGRALDPQVVEALFAVIRSRRAPAVPTRRFVL